jgi:hypothetical protein
VLSVLEALSTEATEAFTADTKLPLIEIYATNFCDTTLEKGIPNESIRTQSPPTNLAEFFN